MNETSNIVALRQPDEIDDPLTNILRAGARQLLAQAVEIEVEAFLATVKDLKLADGRARVVRHGYGPARTIATGIGPVEVARAKIRDRGAAGDGERIRFSSAILPLWARRTRSLDALLPVLYLRGISTGDFQEALTALLGKEAPNLSPAVISRLTAEWQGEYDRWQKRDLSARRYVYVWADGVFLQARMEDHGECMLVLIGATPEGKKELIGFQTGMRESAQSWKELLVDLKARGLAVAPQAAIGDGALGFWKALDEAFPTTRHQRCWLHKTLNVLDKLPKSMQPNAHKDLREIWLSPNRAAADVAMTTFAEKYAPKYDKAVECLIKDRQTLLTFFDLPADHWDHLRTSNPIESVFATVRHRTVRMKGALSQDTARLMVFKLVMAASKTWRRLRGQNQLPKVIDGVKFKDGIEEAAELRDLVGGPGHAAVYHVEDASADDYQSGVEKHALLVVGVGKAKQEGCDDVDQQADKGKGVGRDLSESQAVDNLVEQPLAGPSDCARPGHYASSWIVVSLRTSSSRLPLGVTTSLTSPTFLPSSARPIGEVVEIRPLVTSDSSLVTSLYSISSPLKESNTTMVDPMAALSLGMLAMLTSDRSAMRFLS